MQTTTVLEEGRPRPYEAIVSEANGRLSRDTATLTLDTAIYKPMTVLKESAGKMVRYDGSGDAVAILIHEVDATLADAQAAVFARLAEVTLAELVFADDATQAHKDAAVASLASAFIVAR